MTRLDELTGRLSIRSINTLKRLGYKYIEDLSTEKIERLVLGKKTKQEILEFIERRLKKCIS